MNILVNSTKEEIADAPENTVAFEPYREVMKAYAAFDGTDININN
jgi:hypothetical protein